MNHYSIDIETMGERWSAAVISIGCQQFDIDSGKMGQTFYQEIDLASSLRSGTITADCLMWWMNQTDKAREVLNPAKQRSSLATTLSAFTTWMRGMRGVPTVWGNGATFDISILEHAYDVGCVGLKEAWHFRNIRDMRTLVEVARIDKTKFPTVGTKHNALDDAKFQAIVISAAWRKINAALDAVPAEQPVEDDDEI